jgi:hypothetical protein|nr:MAG TPA: protein of unknown function (DUF1738) [Caudoviricetes sp.]
MSNEEIIAKSAISAGIFSEEEAAAYIMNGLRLPIHTFAEWKNHGYMVKKGEHAALVVSIWKPKTRKQKKDDEKNVDAKEENSGFFLTTAYLFTKQQVEAIKTV